MVNVTVHSGLAPRGSASGDAANVRKRGGSPAGAEAGEGEDDIDWSRSFLARVTLFSICNISLRILSRLFDTVALCSVRAAFRRVGKLGRDRAAGHREIYRDQAFHRISRCRVARQCGTFCSSAGAGARFGRHWHWFAGLLCTAAGVLRATTAGLLCATAAGVLRSAAPAGLLWRAILASSARLAPWSAAAGLVPLITRKNHWRGNRCPPVQWI